jgi:hypothetical protein
MKGIDLLISELATICVLDELCTTVSLAPQKDGCTNAVALPTHAITAAAAFIFARSRNRRTREMELRVGDHVSRLLS